MGKPELQALQTAFVRRHKMPYQYANGMAINSKFSRLRSLICIRLPVAALR
jgi:hypothetical protein